MALIGVCLLWAVPVRALNLLGGDFQLHGFASLTLVNTTDNNFFGYTDDRVSRDFTEVDMNGDELARNPMLSSHVVFEITETAAVSDFHHSIEPLAKLSRANCCAAPFALWERF